MTNNGQLDFFNTTHLAGEELKKEQVAAKGQEEKIMEIFKTNPSGEFSPDDIHYQYVRLDSYTNIPITSIRRAMTNLTTKGLLEKTPNQKIGRYGKKTYTWKLAAPMAEQSKMF